MEHDLTFNSLDSTWARYRVRTRRRPSQQGVILPQLWQRYVTYRKPQVSPTTVDGQYRTVTLHLQACPFTKPEQAIQVRDWLLSHYTPDSTRRTLMQLDACCKWAIRSQLLADNPFKGMAGEIRKRPVQDCRPFTPDETAAILQSFEKSLFYDIVRFLFLTGCRTGEARGLRWKHIARDFSEIKFSEALSGQYDRETDTKNHKARRLPCNHQLRTFLVDIRPEEVDPEARIFYVSNLRSFQSGWARRVKRLVVAGKVAEYRSQYHTRHTFATNCLEAGVTVQQVAEWLGDSPETVLRHYAGVVKRQSPPEMPVG